MAVCNKSYFEPTDAQKRVLPKETMQDIYMQRTLRILIVSLALAAFLPCGTASAWGDKEPTAIIVDDETGDPIEGAIALAQWVKKTFNFEGGIPYAAKARETVSNKEGKIYIRGYWMWIPFTGETTLTVYKPGYALWNSEKKAVYPLEYQPREFSSSNNIVRLVKFEKAAVEWKKTGYTENAKKYPRQLQYEFLGDCFESDLDTNAITMQKIFRRHELPLVKKEEAQRRREYEDSKKK
jgi:hypothetical protein